MHKELINMINSKKITVNRFFTMNPFSSWANKQYSKFSSEINYFEDMNVTTTITIERLATLASLSLDDSYNTLIVTGYSGSGKTSFVRLCEAIINGHTQLDSFQNVCQEIEALYDLKDDSAGTGDVLPEMFGENDSEHDVNELLKLRATFNKSLSNIKQTLYTNYFDKTEDEISNSISNDINEILKGNSVYFDFDADKKDDEEPLETKLTRHIEDHLKNISPKKIHLLCDFYNRNASEFNKAFENRSYYLFSKAINYINENISNDFEKYKDLLSDKLRGLDIDQLLCIEVLLKISEVINSNFTGYIYYFLDNIDMVSGQTNDVLRKTVSKFWDFTSEIQSLMNELRKKDLDENKEWIEIYDKFKYIFAMRETTAMHISDHLRARIVDYSRHFDISEDINKSFIFKKRYNILKKHIQNGDITNIAFLNMVTCIEYITEDKYYKWNLFSLFNNDYRKTIDCLCKICSAYDSPVYQSIPFLKSATPYFKFGGRGIVIKTICDSFKEWDYLSNLKIPTRERKFKNSSYNITLIRIILTVLHNLQKKRSVNEEIPFFVDREQSVSIKQLYDKVEVFCKDKDAFLKCIENMFSSRTWSYWNHLITFDNILEYSEEDLLRALEDESRRYNIYVRCTNAGERYLNTLCVHYEFFSCRFSTENSSLFSTESYMLDNGEYKFQKQIRQVLSSVKNCCNELKLLNNNLLDHLGYDSYTDIINDQIYVKSKKFHEERIIHNHISYLDAYRLYLINGPLKNKVVEINCIVIDFINQYLELLKLDEKNFYSENSRNLYMELTSCISVISENKYQDTATVISRDYYKKHIRNSTN